MSIAKPEILVVVRSVGLGIVPTLLPFLKRDRERMEAVATSISSHSRTTLVWVALRQRRTGALGERAPKVLRMLDWRLVNDFWVVDSEVRLRETVMSTMEPEVMSDGSRIEGNSICLLLAMVHLQVDRVLFSCRLSEGQPFRRRPCRQSVRRASFLDVNWCVVVVVRHGKGMVLNNEWVKLVAFSDKGPKLQGS